VLPMTSAHLDAAPGSETVRTEKVPVRTVADVVAEQRVVPSRTLLKIDTQGFETQVLDGAGDLLRDFAAVQLELSFVALYEGQQLAGALQQRMADAGFVEYGIDAGFADPRTGRMLQCDELFVRGSLLDI
jgi:hypothetical protein